MDAGSGPSPPTTSPPVPSGTVTFAFTDIEGSTVRWDRHDSAMLDAVRRHDAIVREAIVRHGGYVFKTMGDAFCAAFARPERAADAMLTAQRALQRADFAAVDGVRVRMALHTGTADERDGDYFGPAVNRVARLLAIAHGNQILVSSAACALLRGVLPPGIALRDLGDHRLKDLAQPERVHQIVAPDLPREFPPLRSLDTLANNLPLELTSFVGRDGEIATVASLLERHRVVTIVGSGGIGKTRVSLHVAAEYVRPSGDGVWFVELAPLGSAQYVPSAIAQAAGVTLGDGDPVAQLIGALRAKSVLLVLDNCEHLVDAIARVAAALIAQCPYVRILASSRQALGIAGEATYRLPSLPLPVAGPAGALDATELTADRARQYAAIALFAERAEAVDGRFALRDENAAIVADICRRLDGIALGIELAAARVKVLSLHQLRDRLDERFRILTGGGRDRLPRQQTLRALIDWSYDLLDAHEQVFFRRLGIFADSFTLEAAAAVAGDGFDEFDVLDLIGSLTEKSLVLVEPYDDAVRYTLLESTRAYAADKLAAAGDDEAAALRHLHYFRDWFAAVDRYAHELRVNRLRAFAVEQAEVRTALDRARQLGACDAGAALLAAVGTAWSTNGLEREGIARLRASLQALPAAATALRARLGTTLTVLLYNLDRDAEANVAGSAAVGAARASGDRHVLAGALAEHACVLIAADDLAAARAALVEAEAIERIAPATQLVVREARAHLALATGDYATAMRGYADLRAFRRAQHDRRNEAVCANFMAQVAFRRGHYAAAAELEREAIALMRTESQPAALAELLLYAAAAFALAGNAAAAAPPAAEALTLTSALASGGHHAIAAVRLCAYLAALARDLQPAARLAGYGDAALGRESGYAREFVARTIDERLDAQLAAGLVPAELARFKAEGSALSAQAAVALARRASASASAPVTAP